MAGTTNMMRVIAVSGLAALFAYTLNRLVVARSGDSAVKLLVPVMEESLKTGFALAFAVSVPLVHMGFGMYEAVYDFFANPEVGKHRRCLAALLAFLGHAIFGWLTWVVLELRLAALLAIMVVGAMHICWNTLVLAR